MCCVLLKLADLNVMPCVHDIAPGADALLNHGHTLKHNFSHVTWWGLQCWGLDGLERGIER